MTSEELNRAIEFLIKQSAQFFASLEEMKECHERDRRIMQEQTARLTEIALIQSRRLDENDRRFEQNERRLEQNDQELKELKRVNDEILHKIDIIIDRLLPPNNN